MGREAKITYKQIIAVGDALCAANFRPSSRRERERLGNKGSMGTLNRLLQQWHVTQELRVAQPLTLPLERHRVKKDIRTQADP